MDDRNAMEGLALTRPGLVVNLLKGDPAERRANDWLEWDGSWELDVVFLGIPFDGASTVRSGSRHGPDAVRQALMYYTTYSSEAGRHMSDLRAGDIGDVSVVVTDKPTTFRNITGTLSALVARGIKPFSVGGDHSVAEATIAGVCRAFAGKRIGVIHFDAHHDLREAHFGAESSGVPFRQLLETGEKQIRGENLVQIGLSEFCNSPLHADYAREQGVTVFPCLTVRREGMDRIVGEALERAGDGTEAIYVSVDIDAIHQGDAPGTAAPNPFGLDGRDVQLAMRRLARDSRVVGAEVVEISPPFDLHNMTGNLGAALALNFFMGVAERNNRSE